MSLSIEIESDFTLVLLQQAVDVIFRMTLKKDLAEEVGADGEMYPGSLTLSKNAQACLFKLFPVDLVKAGVGHVKAAVDGLHQRMVMHGDTVFEYPPALEAEMIAVDAVKVFNHCMCGEAGAECRGDIVVRP